MRRWTGRETLGVLAGAVAVVLTTWLRLQLTVVIGSDMAMIFFILSVLLAAGIGGAAAGIPTTLFSLTAGVAFIIGPRDFATSTLEWIRVSVFALEGVAISLLVERLQRGTKALRETAEALDAERQRNERLALEDGMTGLGNRRAFQRDLERALSRASRDSTPLTVVMADVDGLKRTNDTLGHSSGDALLLSVAEALRRGCRASDQAYRLGGDEFALLLPNAEREAYEKLADRLGVLLREMCAPFPGTGVSIGAAHAPGDAGEASAVLRLADARMYENKAKRLEALRLAGVGVERERGALDA